MYPTNIIGTRHYGKYITEIILFIRYSCYYTSIQVTLDLKCDKINILQMLTLMQISKKKLCFIIKSMFCL